MVVIGFPWRDWGNSDISVSCLHEMVLKANFPGRNAFIEFNLARSVPSEIEKKLVGRKGGHLFSDHNSHIFAFLDGFILELSEFLTGHLQSPLVLHKAIHESSHSIGHKKGLLW